MQPLQKHLFDSMVLFLYMLVLQDSMMVTYSLMPSLSSVYRGVVVEETVLSNMSRSGVHATAILLELQQGHNPLTSPGKTSIKLDFIG